MLKASRMDEHSEWDSCAGVLMTVAAFWLPVVIDDSWSVISVRACPFTSSNRCCRVYHDEFKGHVLCTFCVCWGRDMVYHLTAQICDQRKFARAALFPAVISVADGRPWWYVYFILYPGERRPFWRDEIWARSATSINRRVISLLARVEGDIVTPSWAQRGNTCWSIPAKCQPASWVSFCLMVMFAQGQLVICMRSICAVPRVVI